MSFITKGYALKAMNRPLEPYEFQRRSPGERDVLIDIEYCGVCFSDVHMVRDDRGWTQLPLVPGHEVVGNVRQVGSLVRKFKPGDRVGVGCFVDSCRNCTSCRDGLEQYCETGFTGTYNALERDGKTFTYGGYSKAIVVDEDYVLRVPLGLAPERVAPLLCAGITTYSPLRQWKVGKGDRIAVLGLGGLGHMAVKLGRSMGAEVAVLSSSRSKEQDAFTLGANEFFHTGDEAALSSIANRFDLIIDAVSAPHDYNVSINLLKRDGVLVLLGVPKTPTTVDAWPLVSRRRKIAGTLIGGIKETQEMLDYCGERGIMSDVEVIRMDEINKAYDRMIRGDVRYRFVIDIGTI